MRIDLEYLAKIINVFLEAPTAHIVVPDFEKHGVRVKSEPNQFNEKFVFHIQIAIDNQLIASKSGSVYTISDIGMNESLDGMACVSRIPIRLTQVGHDFACSLENKEILEKLKSEFKDAPFKVIFEGGQKLLQHFAKKKLDALLEE